ncbi:MAG: 3-deoxy-7-phosphoheptulonate synthase [Bacteroidales bacterium]
MIIQLNSTIEKRQKRGLIEELQTSGYTAREVNTSNNQYLIAQGQNPMDLRSIGNRPYVADIHAINEKYPLVSASWKELPSQIHLDANNTIGPNECTIMAGPCTVEDEAQIEEMALQLSSMGIGIMRGGVFKPRSSPYSYQGLGIEGLKMFHQTAHRHNLLIVSEIMEQTQLEQMYPYVDIFQVGARNSQNFKLLQALGKVNKPVLLKRGISGSIDELLYSAEYIFSGGNEQIILCERGIRTFETSYRNTLDLNAIPILKQKSHLPVVVDPSHGVGIREHVASLALSSIMAGADGLLVEIHKTPKKAISDGFQSLNFSEFIQLIEKTKLTFELKRKFENYS